MATFGWSPEYVRKGITGAQGWAYYMWATAQAAAGMMQGPLEPSGGYISQQIERLRR